MKLVIPNNWNEITVAQYSELSYLGFDYNTINQLILALTDNEKRTIALSYISPDQFDKLIILLSVLLDVDYETIQLLSQEDFLFILQAISKLGQLENKPTGYNYKAMTVGRWINIEEQLAKDKTNIILFFEKLLGKDVSKEFISEYYPYIKEYNDFRTFIYTTYESFFTSNDEDEIEGLSVEEIKHADIARKWNWYGFLYSLAGGDFIKMHEVSDKNLIGAFNFMSYKKQIR